LTTFADADTGKPVVEQVIRSDQCFAPGAQGPALPDMIVQWSSQPTAAHRALVSPRFGTIAWPAPGHNPDGRSGNHRPEGFLMAVGSHIEPGSPIQNGHIIDLAPTIYALLNLAQPAEMSGKALPGLLAKT